MDTTTRLAFPLEAFLFDTDDGDGSCRPMTRHEHHAPPLHTKDHVRAETTAMEGCNEPRAARRLRRHRESMARLRHDQRGRIVELQSHEKVLHRQLKIVLQQMMARDRSDRSIPAVVEFADMVQAAESLEQEKTRLEQELDKRERYQRLVGVEAQRMHANSQQWGSPSLDDKQDRPETPTGCWIQFLDSEPPFFYELETHESSAAAIRTGIHTVELVHRTLSQHSEKVWTVHCLGWKAERSITFEPATSTGINTTTTGRPILRSRMTKRVSRHCTSVQELQDKTWQQVNSAEITSRVYRRAVSLQVVQKLHEDAVVVVRNSPARNNHKRFRFFNLNAKMTFGEDQSLGVLMLNLDKQPQPHPSEDNTTGGINTSSPGGASANATSWLTNGGSRFRFSHVDADWIEIEHVGYIECFDHAHAHHLMFESCAALLRWEHFIVPPRLLAE